MKIRLSILAVLALATTLFAQTPLPTPALAGNIITTVGGGNTNDWHSLTNFGLVSYWPFDPSVGVWNGDLLSTNDFFEDENVQHEDITGVAQRGEQATTLTGLYTVTTGNDLVVNPTNWTVCGWFAFDIMRTDCTNLIGGAVYPCWNDYYAGTGSGIEALFSRSGHYTLSMSRSINFDSMVQGGWGLIMDVGAADEHRLELAGCGGPVSQATLDTVGAWNFFAIGVRGDVQFLFCNGSRIERSHNGEAFTASGPIMNAFNNQAGFATLLYKESIDEITLWDRGLTDEQVNYLFQRGASGFPLHSTSPPFNFDEFVNGP
jgi:hypothetical protein